MRSRFTIQPSRRSGAPRASGSLPATPTVIPRKLLSTMVSEPKAHRALDQPPPVEVGEPVEHLPGVMVATMQPVSEARPRRSAPHHARSRRESPARAATRPQRPWRRRARPRRRPRCQSCSTIIIDAPGRAGNVVRPAGRRTAGNECSTSTPQSVSEPASRHPAARKRRQHWTDLHPHFRRKPSYRARSSGAPRGRLRRWRAGCGQRGLRRFTDSSS